MHVKPFGLLRCAATLRVTHTARPRVSARIESKPDCGRAGQSRPYMAAKSGSRRPARLERRFIAGSDGQASVGRYAVALCQLTAVCDSAKSDPVKSRLGARARGQGSLADGVICDRMSHPCDQSGFEGQGGCFDGPKHHRGSGLGECRRSATQIVCPISIPEPCGAGQEKGPAWVSTLASPKIMGNSAGSPLPWVKEPILVPRCVPTLRGTKQPRTCRSRAAHTTLTVRPRGVQPYVL